MLHPPGLLLSLSIHIRDFCLSAIRPAPARACGIPEIRVTLGFRNAEMRWHGSGTPDLSWLVRGLSGLCTRVEAHKTPDSIGLSWCHGSEGGWWGGGRRREAGAGYSALPSAPGKIFPGVLVSPPFHRCKRLHPRLRKFSQIFTHSPAAHPQSTRSLIHSALLAAWLPTCISPLIYEVFWHYLRLIFFHHSWAQIVRQFYDRRRKPRCLGFLFALSA
jgi:hypothetical protein